jgi:hypothetical protein
VVWYLGEPSPSLGCEGAVDEESCVEKSSTPVDTRLSDRANAPAPPPPPKPPNHSVRAAAVKTSEAHAALPRGLG